MNDVRIITFPSNSIYLLNRKGQRLLVDTGPNYNGAWEHAQSEIKGEIPDQIFITHGHHDHASMGSLWKDFGIPILIGEKDQELVKKPILSTLEEISAITNWLSESGVPAHLIADQQNLLKRRKQLADKASLGLQHQTPQGRWPTSLAFIPFTPDSTIKDQTTWDIASLIPCPGHTVGNFVVAVPEEGWLFSGDQLLPNFDPTPSVQFVKNKNGDFTRFHSLPAYVESLKKLLPYKFKYCFPGHDLPFQNPNERIQESLIRIERRVDKIAEAIKNGIQPNPYDLAQYLYPRYMKKTLWNLIATTQGSLDLLKTRH